jgi:uncharacterized membrane protein (UPF0136 family)
MEFSKISKISEIVFGAIFIILYSINPLDKVISRTFSFYVLTILVLISIISLYVKHKFIKNTLLTLFCIAMILIYFFL